MNFRETLTTSTFEDLFTIETDCLDGIRLTAFDSAYGGCAITVLTPEECDTLAAKLTEAARVKRARIEAGFTAYTGVHAHK